MKVTENGNYGHYLGSSFREFFSEPANYLYLGLIAAAFGLYWNKEGLETTLRIFFVMTNGFTVTFLLTEVIMTLRYREFKKNKYTTLVLTIAGLTTINLIFFDGKAVYWSFVTGLIFMVPVVVYLLVTKIRTWLL